MLRRRIMLAQGGVSLPAGYTKIEYLESDGSQFIDTGYSPNNNTRVVMEASLLSLDGDQYFYGAKDSGSTQSFVGAYSDGAVTFGYANSFPSAAFDLQIEEKMLIDQNREKGLVNGELVATANTATFQTPCTLYLCARNNDGEASKVTKARIYSCKIYDNGTLVRDFIPAMNASGEAGLYDLKNDVWYALLPVAKPKVENQIKLSLKREYATGVDGTTIVVMYGSLTSEEEVASDVKAAIYNSFTGSNALSSLTIKEGAHGSNGYSLLGLHGEYRISSISPTEDDTYIYTF